MTAQTAITIYGVLAVSFMMDMYALERRHRGFILAFAVGCLPRRGTASHPAPAVRRGGSYLVGHRRPPLPGSRPLTRTPRRPLRCGDPGPGSMLGP